MLGSNDYFGPVPKNPARYLTRKHAEVKGNRADLPVGRLVEGLREGGWADLNNARTVVRMGDHDVELVGVDDPHVGFDRYHDGVRARRRRRDADDGAAARALPAGARRDGGRRCLGGARRAHPRRPAGAAGVGCAGDQLRPRHPAGQGRVAVVAGRGLLGPGGWRGALVARRRGMPRGCTSLPGSAPRRTLRCASPAGRRPPCSRWSRATPEPRGRAGGWRRPDGAGPISAGRGGSAILGCRRAPGLGGTATGCGAAW